MCCTKGQMSKPRFPSYTSKDKYNINYDFHILRTFIQIFFQRFINNGICRKELHLERNENRTAEEASAGTNINTKLVISLLEKKDGVAEDILLCKFYIDETRIFPKQLTETGHSP